jgi:hypothetical protein
MSEAKTSLPKLQDDARAPELYAAAATGFFNANGVISITLESARADHSKTPAPVSRVVVGRLVMPAGGAQALAVGLFDFLEKQGFSFKK